MKFDLFMISLNRSQMFVIKCYVSTKFSGYFHLCNFKCIVPLLYKADDEGILPLQSSFIEQGPPIKM